METKGGGRGHREDSILNIKVVDFNNYSLVFAYYKLEILISIATQFVSIFVLLWWEKLQQWSGLYTTEAE